MHSCWRSCCSILDNNSCFCRYFSIFNIKRISSSFFYIFSFASFFLCSATQVSVSTNLNRKSKMRMSHSSHSSFTIRNVFPLHFMNRSLAGDGSGTKTDDDNGDVEKGNVLLFVIFRFSITFHTQPSA